MDHGPEFISKDVGLWAYWNKVRLAFSRTGYPTDNATIQLFNSVGYFTGVGVRHPALTQVLDVLSRPPGGLCHTEGCDPMAGR